MRIGKMKRWYRKAMSSLIAVTLVTGTLLPAVYAEDVAVGADWFGSGNGSSRMNLEMLSSGTVTQTVYPRMEAAPPAPVLAPIPEVVNEEKLEITGTAEAGAEVTVLVSRDGEMPTEGGKDIAEDGHFRVEVTLSKEGSYRITAVAALNGQASGESAAAQVRLDKTAPPEPVFGEWLTIGIDRVKISWTPGDSAIDTVKYKVERDGKLLGEVTEPEFTEPNVPELSALVYRVSAQDAAGNVSNALEIMAGTAHHSLLHVNSTPEGLAGNGDSYEIVISGDGTKALFSSKATNLVPGLGDSQIGSLYTRNLKIGEVKIVPFPAGVEQFDSLAINENGKTAALRATVKGATEILFHSEGMAEAQKIPTADGQPPNQSTSAPSISADGERVVFASQATNWTIGEPEDFEASIYMYQRSINKVTRIQLPEEVLQIEHPVLSGDGRFIVFNTGCGECINRKLYLHETAQPGKITLIGEGGFDKNISYDGRYIVYDKDDGIYLYDSEASGEMKTRRIVGDAPGVIDFSQPKISGNGRYVFVTSYEPWSQWGFQRQHLNVIDLTDPALQPKLISNPAEDAWSASVSKDGGKLGFASKYTSGYDENGNDLTSAFIVCPQKCRDTPPPGDKPISSVTWKADMAGRAQVKLGGTIRMTVNGAVHRKAAVSLTYRQGDIEKSSTLELVEDTAVPGQYTGIFDVTEGMASIQSIIGQVADGAGTMISLPANGLPVTVSGALQVDISNLLNPDQSVNEEVKAALAGSRLVTWSASKKAGAQASFRDNAPFAMALTDADDYKLTLLAADGSLLAEHFPVAIGKGQTSSVSIRALIPSTVVIGATTAEGGLGLVNIPVTLYNEDQTVVLAAGSTDRKGQVRLAAGFVGDTVHIKTDLPRPYSPLAASMLTLDSREIQLPLSAVIHYGTVSGQAKDRNGEPLGGVKVSIQQDDRTLTAVTETDGTYKMRVTEGDVFIEGYREVSGEDRTRTRKPALLKVEAGKEHRQDLVLHKESTATIHLKLFTKQVGGSFVERNLDIPTMRVLTPSVKTEAGKPQAYTAFDNGLTIQGLEGENYEVCVKDGFGQMGGACKSVTIDAQMQATAVLELEEQVAVKGKLRIADPGVWTINAGFVELAKQTSVPYALQEGNFHISLPKDGSYQAIFQAINRTGQVRKGVKNFTARKGELIELGDIELKPERDIYFRDPAANLLEAMDSTVAEGSRVTLRGSYRNGSQVNLLAPALMIRIPQGMSFVPDSMMLGGIPVPEGQITSVSPSLVRVSLVKDLNAQESRTVTFQLQVEQVKSDLLPVELGISFLKPGSAEAIEEQIASTLIPTTQVSIDAPAKAKKSSDSGDSVITVSGRAVPGSSVQIYDGSHIAGTTTASQGGYWSQTLTLLPERAEGRIHAVSAVAVKGSDEWRSKQAFVEVADDNEPLPLELAMFTNGYRLESKLAEGVLRFPLSVNPHKPISFSLLFRHPDRVQDVTIGLAGEKIPMTYNRLTGRYEGVKSTPQRNLGPVSLSYDVIPEPFAAVENEDQIRKSMPPVIRDLQGEVLPPEQSVPESTEGDPANRIYLNKVVLTSKDSPDEKIETQYFYRIMPDDYQPGKPIQKSSQGVYDLKFSYSKQAKMIQVSVVMPANQAKTFIQSMNGDVAGLAINPYIEVGTKIRYELKTPGSPSALGLASAIYAGYDYQQKMDQLNDFMDQVNASDCMAPNSVQHYYKELEELSERLFINLLTKYALQITAMNLAAIGIGIPAGLGVVAASLAINYAMNSAWEDDLSAMQQQFADQRSGDDCEDEDEVKDPRRPKDPRDPDDQDIVDPYWIYDPSGYAYEAVESNRLAGVTTTAMYLDPADQLWKKWDAAIYGQRNPLLTNAEGRYAWDVPEGKWQVLFEKEDYELARSAVLEVLPPHFDVNVGLVSKAAPTVTAVLPESAGGGVRVFFSKYMQPETVASDLIRLTETASAVEIPLAVEAVQPENSPSGQPLAKQFRIVPAVSLKDGQTYRLFIDAMVQSYVGVPMADHYDQSFIAVVAPVAEAVKADSVNLIAGTDALTVRWEELTEKRYDHFKVIWKENGAAETLLEETVGKGVGYSTATGLANGKSYEVIIQTVDLDGRTSDGVRNQGNTQVVIPPVENANPGRVTEAVLKAENGGLTLTWKDPADADLRGVRVALKKTGESAFGRPVEVAKGVQQHRLENVSAPGAYEAQLESVDLAGKRSPAAKAAVLISGSGEEPGGGAGPGPGSGGGNPEQPQIPASKDEAAFKIADGTERYAAFDGMLLFRLPIGALAAGTEVKVTRTQTPPAPNPASHRAYSSYVTITSEAQLSKPAQLVWKLPEAEGLDPRKLAVYRLDLTAPGGWQYIGGFANLGQNRLHVKLSDWGTYAVMAYDKPFRDLTGHWSEPEAGVLISRHLVDGVDENRYSPDAPVTRAQVAKLVTGLLEREGRLPAPIGETPTFRDVLASAWYAQVVQAAAAIGLVQGAGGEFRPDAPISREELAVILQRVMKEKAPAVPAEQLQKFDDAAAVSGWSAEAMSLMVQEGIMNGVTDTMIEPQGMTTRAQMAVILVRLLERWNPVVDIGAE